MSEQHLDAYEERARDAAGERAGAYLDTLGKTDLATLHPDEWATFVEAIVTGFEQSLREQLGAGAAPF